MGYTGPYSLGSRVLTEFLGTFLAMFLGLSIVANELLPSTKGHSMGFGWIAFGFGMAFTTAIQIFSYASAHINPAACLALWVRGDLDAVDFFALSAAEMCGGFAAACLVYLFFLPHFKTVPEIGTGSPEDHLLRTRDVIEPSALRYASYNTKTSASTASTLAKRLAEARYYLSNEAYDDAPEKVLEHLVGRTYTLHGVEVPFPAATSGDEEGGKEKKVKRRHSLQVADMQRRLRKAERELAGEGEVMDDINLRPSAVTVNDTLQPTTSTQHSPKPVEARPQRDLIHKPSKSSIMTTQAREDAISRATLAADQATKLSVFATRPAIYLPLHNFFVEMIGTATLIFGAFLIDDHLKSASLDAGVLPGSHPATAGTVRLVLDASFSPLLKGLFIMVLVLGLGGPTGFAANPARDLAPRLAHFLLPIPGKGSSEWNYGIITNLAGLCGGLLGGGLYSAVHLINRSL
ncbi:hypothetical protein HDU67_006310 [Dinochytrium kinnereticum]|nr:hypothetical protein HDU67_006310 [Dinochytrium kinnereticum]